MIKAFQSFIAKMKVRFNRLAKSTRSEKEVEDLHNDAMVIALQIAHDRGRHVDLSDPDDEDLVMRELYLENMKRGDWKMRYAVRIDHQPDWDEEGTSMLERLPAHASSDPLVSLLVNESAIDPDTLVRESYSQASAYMVTFGRLVDQKRICAHLLIPKKTLWRRVSSAVDAYKQQPSVFDGKERIPADFLPLPGKKYPAKIGDKREAGQWTWDFS